MRTFVLTWVLRAASALGADASAAPVSDLPFVFVPAQGDRTDAPLAILLTGDGGWARLAQDLSRFLSQQGVPVLGLNSLRYFWHAKEPDQAARDLVRLVHHGWTLAGRRKLLLLGYSRGADVLPAVAARLPSSLLDQVALLAFLGLSKSSGFEFHFRDWWGKGKGGSPVLPEIVRLKGRPMLCVYGDQEKDSLCPELEARGLAQVQALPGGHHFGGATDQVASLILEHSQGDER